MKGRAHALARALEHERKKRKYTNSLFSFKMRALVVVLNFCGLERERYASATVSVRLGLTLVLMRL